MAAMTAGTDAPDLPETHYLDNRIFTDDDIFADEMRCIFAATWLFVCHEGEIAGVGDYRATSAGGKPIVIVRGADDVVRAFYNVCRHRGAPVVRDDAGTATGFQCFYHLWTYGLDGRCTGIAKPEGYVRVGLDKDKLALVAVRCEILAGLVFVSLDAAAGPLEDYLGDIMAPLMAPLATVKLDVFHFHKGEVATNWKLWQDNNSERYHALLHAINRKTMPWVTGRTSPMKLRLFDNGHSGYWSDGEATVDYAAGGYAGVTGGPLPGMRADEMRVINLFPDTMINIRSNVIRIDRMVPLAPGRTLVEWRGLGAVADSDDMRAEQLRHHNMFWGPAGRNLPEDLIAVEAQWAGMSADVVRYSILAREEDLNPTDDANVRAYYREWGRRMGRRPHAPFSAGGESGAGKAA
jgi:phenylpropionate dioxygenase-like ring-hydroxylating dioxygenase large terminal subunit